MRGCTALIDAIGGAIHHIGNVHKYARPEDVPEHTMFVITTDGMENASHIYTSDGVKAMVERQKEKYGWEFLFIGANIDSVETAGHFGIDSNRAVNYHADKAGTKVLYETVSETVCCMRADIKVEMPDYLEETDFDLWLEQFCDTVESLGLGESAPEQFNLEIEFSDEKKLTYYGCYSPEEILELISEQWKIDTEIKRIVMDIKKYRDYRQRAQELAEQIRGVNPGSDYEDIISKLDEWFKDIRFEGRVLGEYDNNRKRITFYTKNIECSALPGRTHKQNFEKVFMHEMFHAHHYRFGDEEIILRHDYTSSVVKESLAAAYEWQYCIRKGIPGADEMEEAWRDNPVRTYPYSGALEFIEYPYSGYRCIDRYKAVDVYTTSFEDMDAAR